MTVDILITCVVVVIDCAQAKITDLKIKTGSSICCSEMKSFAAILVGQIHYIENPLGAAFFFDDCWNVMNAQHETE